MIATTQWVSDKVKEAVLSYFSCTFVPYDMGVSMTKQIHTHDTHDPQVNIHDRCMTRRHCDDDDDDETLSHVSSALPNGAMGGQRLCIVVLILTINGGGIQQW